MKPSIRLAGVVFVLLVALAVLFWSFKGRAARLNPKVNEFHEDANHLIAGLQQYKEFVGNYPTGDCVEISRALSGQTDQKILIVATSKNKKNAKGEIVDPWGTPLRFFFGENSVFIWSAGPNRVFEDSTVPAADDLFRSEFD